MPNNDVKCRNKNKGARGYTAKGIKTDTKESEHSEVWTVFFEYRFHDAYTVTTPSTFSKDTHCFYCDLEMRFEWIYTKNNHHFLGIKPENGIDINRNSRRTVRGGKVAIYTRYSGVFYSSPSGICDIFSKGFFVKLSCHDDVQFVFNTSRKNRPRIESSNSLNASVVHVSCNTTHKHQPCLILSAVTRKRYDSNAYNSIISMVLWFMMLIGWHVLSLLGHSPSSDAILMKDVDMRLLRKLHTQEQDCADPLGS